VRADALVEAVKRADRLGGISPAGCLVDRGLYVWDLLGPVGVSEQVGDGKVLEQERPGQAAVMGGLRDERPAG
jgi:hypothetical protein